MSENLEMDDNGNVIVETVVRRRMKSGDLSDEEKAGVVQ